LAAHWLFDVGSENLFIPGFDLPYIHSAINKHWTPEKTEFHKSIFEELLDAGKTGRRFRMVSLGRYPSSPFFIWYPWTPYSL
jgi:hypothetical protein